MILKKGTSIYQQIADFGIDQLLNGSWTDGGRIPSVRSLAIDIGVTPNTVMRAYRDLEDLGVVETKRGTGFFVADNGRDAALTVRRREFLDDLLPGLRRNLRLLGISPRELVDLLEAPDDETTPDPSTDNTTES